MASIKRSLWRPLCLHSATTATLEPQWQWFCLHSAFFARPVVPLQQLWSFKEGTRVVLQQLHRNRTFWVPATIGCPNHFYGCTKVAQRSQPCVKGAYRRRSHPRPSNQVTKKSPSQARSATSILYGILVTSLHLVTLKLHVHLTGHDITGSEAMVVYTYGYSPSTIVGLFGELDIVQ